MAVSPVGVGCVPAHVGAGAAAVYLEISTSPPLPVSSSCSLLSGTTRGAGLNYGDEPDRDTGCSNVVCRPGRTRHTSLRVPYPETRRPSAVRESVCVCVYMREREVLWLFFCS